VVEYSPSMKLRKSSPGDVIEGTPVDDIGPPSSRIWDDLQRKKELISQLKSTDSFGTLQTPADVEYMSSFTDVINSLARDSDLQTPTSQATKLLSKSLGTSIHISPTESPASQKKLREEKRNKDKMIVKLFVFMLTCETEEVEKSVPSNLQEIIGIEKQKLWELFQKYLGDAHTSVTSSVFWKYVVGKQRGQYEAPLYSTNEFHKEVLKAGVKRITGVRWRDPLSPSDREKIEYNYNELLKLGIQLDSEMINKELSQLLKQHDDRVKKNPKPMTKVKNGTPKLSMVSSPPIQTVGNSQEIPNIQPNGMNTPDVNTIVNALQPIVNQMMINTSESAQLSANSTTIIDSNQLQQLLMLMSQLLQALQNRPS